VASRKNKSAKHFTMYMSEDIARFLAGKPMSPKVTRLYQGDRVLIRMCPLPEKLAALNKEEKVIYA
jgi:hypothetical protein